jgi:hypothetical protein
MLFRTRKTTNHKRLNLSHRRTRFESLESRLCLSGCSISGTVYDARFDPPPDVDYQPLAGVHLFVDVDGAHLLDSRRDDRVSGARDGHHPSDDRRRNQPGRATPLFSLQPSAFLHQPPERP